MTHGPFTISAQVYDAIYATEAFDYPRHAAAVTSLVEKRRPGAATLLEVGCGTGLFLERFAERFDLAGVDVSPQMLEVAARRLPEVPLHTGDMREFSIDRSFDAVVCLFSSIGYMITAHDLRAALAAMASHLVPGGVLVVDGWLRPSEVDEGHVGVGTGATDELSVARMSYTRLADGATDMEMHHLVGRPGRGIEYFVERHVMGLHEDADFIAALTAAGLDDIEVVDGYPGRSRFVAVRH